ncbi:hypothetical protein A2U01_0026085, partial [Trifolium medium]|nr:hypothetical protein [Trifolium medium]
KNPVTPPKTQKEEGKGKETARKAINTIAGGFYEGGETSSARKRYTRLSTHGAQLVGEISFPHVPDLSFTAEDGRGVLPHDNDPLLAGEQLQPYQGTLVGFSREQVEVMGHITLLTTFGEDDHAKTVKVRYLVIKTPFTSYNIIIGRPTVNALRAAMSTLYLSMKYPLDNGGVGIVKGDQALARRCYQMSLKGNTWWNASNQDIKGDSVNLAQEALDEADIDPDKDFQESKERSSELSMRERKLTPTRRLEMRLEGEGRGKAR